MRKNIITVLLAAAAVVSAGADMQLTVPQLKAFIQSSVSLKQPDRQVAEYLKHVKLTGKLDDQTIEDLQTAGAGPKTVAALKGLGSLSASTSPSCTICPSTNATFTSCPSTRV